MDITKGNSLPRLVSGHSRQGRKCTKCDKGELDTCIHRPALFKFFLGWVTVKRYQCNSCRKKVYIWK